MSDQELKTLRTTLSREDFKQRSFNKSKSWGSSCALDASLKNFDRFCLAEYGKQTDEIISELKERKGDYL